MSPRGPVRRGGPPWNRIHAGCHRPESCHCGNDDPAFHAALKVPLRRPVATLDRCSCGPTSSAGRSSSVLDSALSFAGGPELSGVRVVALVLVAMTTGSLVIGAPVTNASAAASSAAVVRAAKLEQVVSSAIVAGAPGAVEESHGTRTPISCWPDNRANFSGPLHYRLTEQFALPDHASGPSAIRRISKALGSHFPVELLSAKDSAVVQAPRNGTLEGRGMFVVVLWSKTKGLREVEAEIQSACDVSG